MTIPPDEFLQRMWDEHEIAKTLFRWSHAIDFGRTSEFIDCFTEDGELLVFSSDWVVAGPEAWTDFVERHREGRHLHNVTTPLIEVDGDHATAESFALRIDADAQRSPFIYAFAVYKDRLVRCPDGRWRIESRFVDRLGHATDVAPPRH